MTIMAGVAPVRRVFPIAAVITAAMATLLCVTTSFATIAASALALVNLLDLPEELGIASVLVIAMGLAWWGVQLFRAALRVELAMAADDAAAWH